MKYFIFFIITVLFITGEVKLFSQNTSPADSFENVSEKYFYSKTLDENRRLFISLPKVYSENLSYPVIYLLDGELIKQYEETLKCTRTNSDIGTHIIIGVETANNRNRDMIPCKMYSRPEAGDADRFLQFLIKELQPFVDSSYNTNGKNILYGASTAGLFTIYAILDQPDAFYGYIASSPMIGHCSDFMNKKAMQFNPKSKLEGKYLYIHYGMKDHFKQVTEYLPIYYEMLSRLFIGNLISEMNALKNEGHVPVGGIEEGLIFIYNNK